MAKPSGRPPLSKDDVSEFRSKVAKHALAIYRAEGFTAVSMRRLAKEVGCAPMTIYAHFDGKTDILRYLWADVLTEMTQQVRHNLTSITDPVERLHICAQTFVAYWIDQSDHFRLVFMSNDVTRSDVNTFMKDDKTLEHFQMFFDLVRDVLPKGSDVKTKTDTLIAAMIGIALCCNTIRDYPWTDAPKMTEHLIAGIIG